MADYAWLEEYISELQRLQNTGDVKEIRRRNMELINRIEYVKDEEEKEVFLKALYETEEVLAEHRREEKEGYGLKEYTEPAKYKEYTKHTEWNGLSERERFEEECKRAEEGNAEAFLRLADYYRKRTKAGTEQWTGLMKKAAEGGNKAAIKCLARLYCEGKEVERNPGSAHYYFEKLGTEGDIEDIKANCLLYYEEERYDMMYPYAKTLIESGRCFDPENNWSDTCLLVIYTMTGIRYGELQWNQENLTRLRQMVRSTYSERKADTDRDKKILYTTEYLYIKAAFMAGRHIGVCHTIPKNSGEFYVYAILDVALEAGGRVQNDVWEELLLTCRYGNENYDVRHRFISLITDRMSSIGKYGEALFFADRALCEFGSAGNSVFEKYREKYTEIMEALEKKGEQEVFRCLSELVKRGSKNPAYSLAECYYYGRGCERDYSKAKLYYRVAENGIRRADCLNGICSCDAHLALERAMAVLKTDNYEEAVAAIKGMAERGSISEVHYEYARILEQGILAVKDDYKAFQHYAYAAAKGHSQAKKHFSELKRSHPDYWKGFENDEENKYKLSDPKYWRVLRSIV